MSNPGWIDQVNWNELTTTLNNLDPDHEYELRGENTIWRRPPEVLVDVDHTWSVVSDPIRILIQLRNLVKPSISMATHIVITAVRYGYEE